MDPVDIDEIFGRRTLTPTKDFRFEFYVDPVKGNDMAKYSKKSQSMVKRAVHRFKEGTLRSGSGAKVKNRRQAIAIGLSEAREMSATVPPVKNNN